MQQRVIEALVDGGAQPADVHVDHIGLRIEVQIPYGLEQHGARDHLAGAPRQELQQLEFLGGEIDFPARSRDLAAQQVELEIRHADARRGFRLVAAAEQGLDAGKQLAEGKEVETDFETLYGLYEAARDNPTAFSTVNLRDFVDKLSKQDLEQLANMQLSIRNADRRAADAVIDGFMTNQQIVNDALLSAGLDPTPAPGSEQIESVIRLRREVDRQVQALQTRTGKKATNQDVQTIVDELLTTVTLEKGTWLGFFTSGPFTDVQKRIGEVTIADMPAQLRRQAEDSLRRNGQVVTDESVLALYRRYLLQQNQGNK